MRRRSFTLIELLVVITVISILAGILLPALMKAREMVKLTVCVNSSKTLYLGQVQFSNDNNGFPCDNGGNNRKRVYSNGMFLPHSTARIQLFCYQPIIKGKYWDFAWLQCPGRPINEYYEGATWDLKQCAYVRDFPESARWHNENNNYPSIFEISKLKPVWGSSATNTKSFVTCFLAVPETENIPRLGKNPMNVFMADIRPFTGGSVASDPGKPYSYHMHKEGTRICRMPITFGDGAVDVEPIRRTTNNWWVYWDYLFRDMRRDNLNRIWQ